MNSPQPGARFGRNGARAALCSCILSTLLIGVVLTVRSGLSGKSEPMHVRLASRTQHGAKVTAVWLITGTGDWTQLIKDQSLGLGHLTVIGRDRSRWFLRRSRPMAPILYVVNVTVGPLTAPHTYQCTETIDVSTNSGAFAASSGGSFGSSTNDLSKLVSSSITTDLVLRQPGRVLLGRVDEQPLILEFRK